MVRQLNLVPPAQPASANRATGPARGTDAPPNRAWARLATAAGPLQTKLTVNTPGDQHEQEADQIADQVLRMPDPQAAPLAGAEAAPQIQRLCSACGEEEKVQRELPQEDDEKKMQAKELSAGAVPEVGPQTEARIGAMQGGGAPLSPDLRSYFEPRLGQDLSAVRLHTGSEAQAAADEVQARAFTVGSNIAFGKSEFRPETDDGKRLLAHELVHTAQQGQTTELSSGD